MPMPKDELQKEMIEAWGTYLDALERSLDLLDVQIREAAEMAGTCTNEWCEATEHFIDDLSNSLFSISEPHWSSKEDEQRIKRLKHRVHDLYANYRSVYKQAGVQRG